MRTTFTNLLLVTTYQIRILWREFSHSVRTTPEGKLALLFMVGGPFLMKEMLVSGALRQANLDEDAAWVILGAAHLSMTAALVSGVASRTARSLVVDRREDPLAQYPHAREGLASFHLWGAIVSPTILGLLIFFYLFYGPLVSRLAAEPVTGTLLHLIGHTAISLALGAVAYRLTLRGLEWRPALGRPLFLVTGVTALFAFLAMVGAPQFLGDLASHRIADLRSFLDSVGWLYAPFTPLGPSPVRPASILSWSLGVGAAGAIALGAAAPLIQSPSMLLFGETRGPVSRHFKSVFSDRKRPSTAPVVHGARLFFLKDVLLDTVRSPRVFIGRQVVFLGTASLASYLAWGLLQEGLLGENEAEALVLGLVVFLVCAAAYLGGLGSLGSEGPALVLLRPVVRASDLLLYKTFAVMASVVPAGLLYGAAAGALSQALDMRPGPIVAAGIGGLTAVVATAFAVSLAFLFPDLERRNIFVPGSSRVGRYTFSSVALYGAGVVGGLRWMTRSGMLPPSTFLPSLMTLAGMGMAVTGIVMMLALRRFHHLEH